MRRLQDLEGYLLIDNRAAGLGMQEMPTYTCSHCHRVVIMNPKRTRERVYCRGCDHHICDECAATKAKTLECRTFNQIADEIMNQAAKA